MTVHYDCLSNDNEIRIFLEDGIVDGVGIGCPYLPKEGYSIVDIEDLKNALALVGLKVISE